MYNNNKIIYTYIVRSTRLFEKKIYYASKIEKILLGSFVSLSTRILILLLNRKNFANLKNYGTSTNIL